MDLGHFDGRFPVAMMKEIKRPLDTLVLVFVLHGVKHFPCVKAARSAIIIANQRLREKSIRPGIGTFYGTESGLLAADVRPVGA
jgi:hypothetical protein